MLIYVDTETRSPVPIRDGTDKYMTLAECTIVTWAIDNGPVKVWDRLTNPTPPSELLMLVANQHAMFIAHNSQFDYAVFTRLLKWDVPVNRFMCTRAQAYAHGLPGGLDGLCAALGVPMEYSKLAGGKRLIQLFCVPKKDGTYVEPSEKPAEWQEFIDYALRDVDAMRAAHRRLPAANYRGTDLSYFWLDAAINIKGFAIDIPLIEATVALLDHAKSRGDESVSELTHGAVTAYTQRNKLLAYLIRTGLQLPNLRKSELESALQRDDLSPEHRLLIESRLEGARASGAKYKRALKMHVGGRLRYTQQFSGAGRTGRTAHKGFQPGNMPRAVTYNPYAPTLAEQHVPVKAKFIDEIIIPAIRNGTVQDGELIWGGPNTVAANCLKHTIIAEPGNEFTVADYKNIESRVLAWIAGEEWKLTAYAYADTNPGDKTRDLYRMLYSRFFGADISTVNDHQRNSAKVIELACFSAETECLTDRGYVAMVDVLESDLLWDGVEWVSHKGLVAKGVQPVVDVDGISVTPSHLVMLDHFWVEARELVTSPSTLSQALARGSANLPLQARRQVPVKARVSSFNVRAALLTTLMREPFDVGSRRDATNARSESQGSLLLPGASLSTPSISLIQNIVAGSSIGSAPLLGAVIDRTIRATRTTVAEALRLMRLGVKIVAHSWRTLSQWMGGTTPPSKWIAAQSTETMCRAILDSLRSKKTCAIDGDRKTCSGESLTSKPVYDIAHAGPRNRFTVRTNSGHLLAHNCGFGGSVGAFATMAIGYGMDLDALPAIILPNVDAKVLAKAERAWWRAFLERKDFDLAPDTFITCHALVQGYRAANSKIDGLKRALGRAVENAVRIRGSFHEVGRCKIWADASVLIVELPSGYRLCYWNPEVEVEQVVDPEDGEIEDRVFLSFKRARGSKMIRERSWPGLTLENIVQAIANQLLRNGKIEANKRYPNTLVLAIHDEAVSEARAGAIELPVFMDALCKGWHWTSGLPLAADGWQNTRFGKR